MSSPTSPLVRILRVQDQSTHHFCGSGPVTSDDSHASVAERCGIAEAAHSSGSLTSHRGVSPGAPLFRSAGGDRFLATPKGVTGFLVLSPPAVAVPVANKRGGSRVHCKADSTPLGATLPNAESPSDTNVSPRSSSVSCNLCSPPVLQPAAHHSFSSTATSRLEFAASGAFAGGSGEEDEDCYDSISEERAHVESDGGSPAAPAGGASGRPQLQLRLAVPGYSVESSGLPFHQRSRRNSRRLSMESNTSLGPSQSTIPARQPDWRAFRRLSNGQGRPRPTPPETGGASSQGGGGSSVVSALSVAAQNQRHRRISSQLHSSHITNAAAMHTGTMDDSGVWCMLQAELGVSSASLSHAHSHSGVALSEGLHQEGVLLTASGAPVHHPYLADSTGSFNNLVPDADEACTARLEQMDVLED